MTKRFDATMYSATLSAAYSGASTSSRTNATMWYHVTTSDAAASSSSQRVCGAANERTARTQ